MFTIFYLGQTISSIIGWVGNMRWIPIQFWSTLVIPIIRWIGYLSWQRIQVVVVIFSFIFCDVGMPCVIIRRVGFILCGVWMTRVLVSVGWITRCLVSVGWMNCVVVRQVYSYYYSILRQLVNILIILKE
jgi:hypothetical protein